MTKGHYSCKFPHTAVVVRLVFKFPGTGVRLVGGSTPNEGRVEVYYNGTWGTVCDGSWGWTDASVVCRMLGYPEAVSAPSRAHFGQGTGRIWLDEVDCSGSETSLFDCSHNGWGRNDCFHFEDAGVVCRGEQVAM